MEQRAFQFGYVHRRMAPNAPTPTLIKMLNRVRLPCHVSLHTIPRRPLETTVLAHAPGFTVLEHAYWRNPRYRPTWFLHRTMVRWSPHVGSLGTPISLTRRNTRYDSSSTTRWDDSVARVVTPKEAINLDLDVRNVEVVQGSSVRFAWVCGLTNFVVEKDLAMEDKKGQYHHMLQTNLTEEP
jgi:hypothetical protein